MTPREIACAELVELLTEYLEGALPPDEVAVVEAHLAACEACRTTFRELFARSPVAYQDIPRLAHRRRPCTLWSRTSPLFCWL